MAGVKPLLETIGALLPKGIKAWHASPHDFEKFDLSKIGTGQGAASYGPGIYAAESPAVSGVGGEYWKEFARGMVNQETGGAKKYALDVLADNHGNKDKAIEFLNYKIEQNPRSLNAKSAKEALWVLQNEHVGPRVYELNIKADPQSFLQWDKPLAEQPNIAKAVPQLLHSARNEAYNRALSATSGSRRDQLYDMVKNPEQATGEFAYHGMRGVEHGSAAAGIGLGKQAAMDTLRDAGIPGIRYADAHTRALGADNADRIAALTKEIAELRAGGHNLRASELDQTLSRLQRVDAMPRTYNYVLNNPDIIEIMRKLAIPGMVGGGAATAYQPQGQQ